MMRAGRQTASYASLPAPVGGLNARDALAAMPEKDAVVLENWWPYPTEVAIRKGYSDWSTGYPATVESLFVYNPKSGASKLFAAAGTSFYDATAQGAVGAAVVTGLSNAQWQYTNIQTPGVAAMYCMNGVDKPRYYDGTTWVAVDAASTPAITGVTTANLVQPVVYKKRLWMVEKNTMKVWYLSVESIGGAATAFDLSTVFQGGGYLMAMATWTIDAGDGVDDHAVFISSEGEVAVYKGSDPGSSTDWFLVGDFHLGRPIGRKCVSKFGGDLLVICSDGVFPLAKGLLSATVNRDVAITDKIQRLISEASTLYSDNYGWIVNVHYKENMIVLNIPAGNGENFQFAQNTITGAWTMFTGWNASTFDILEDEMYFGDGTGVRKAWAGYLDGINPIVADGLPAFSTFRSMAQNKQFTEVRPYLLTNGNPSILYGLNVDYYPQDVSGVLSFTAPNPTMTWGSMVWGSMVWGGSLVNITAPRTVGSVGRAASLRIKAQGNGAELRWAATDFAYQRGGFV